MSALFLPLCYRSAAPAASDLFLFHFSFSAGSFVASFSESEFFVSTLEEVLENTGYHVVAIQEARPEFLQELNGDRWTYALDQGQAVCVRRGQPGDSTDVKAICGGYEEGKIACTRLKSFGRSSGFTAAPAASFLKPCLSQVPLRHHHLRRTALRSENTGRPLPAPQQRPGEEDSCWAELREGGH